MFFYHDVLARLSHDHEVANVSRARMMPSAHLTCEYPRDRQPVGFELWVGCERLGPGRAQSGRIITWYEALGTKDRPYLLTLGRMPLVLSRPVSSDAPCV